MSLFSFTERRVQRMTVWDIGLLKILCVLAGMLLGAWLVEFVLANQVWFVVALAVTVVGMVARFFGRK